MTETETTATETEAEKVSRLSRAAVVNAVREDEAEQAAATAAPEFDQPDDEPEEVVEDTTQDRPRRFTITKFGRHEDGYLHARVTGSDGRPVYVHRRYGSWMAPGMLNGKPVLKDVLRAVAEALQKKARSLEKKQPEVLYDATQTNEQEATNGSQETTHDETAGNPSADDQAARPVGA